MAYDPQKTRNRPAPAVDRPAPVDAFLDAVPAANELQQDTAVSAVLVEELVVDAAVEAVVDVAVEDVVGEAPIGSTTRTPFDPAEWEGDTVVATRSAGRSRLLLAGGAAIVAVVAVVVWSRRRR
jgi:hypothetical protein